MQWEYHPDIDQLLREGKPPAKHEDGNSIAYFDADKEPYCAQCVIEMGLEPLEIDYWIVEPGYRYICARCLEKI